MDQCCCLSDDADFDYACFSEKMIKKSRKEHVCCECHRTIEVGEKYHVATGVHDGKWETLCTCLGCLRLIAEYSCGPRVFETLADDIWECLGVSIIDGSTIDEDD